jgi:hypothetical protein
MSQNDRERDLQYSYEKKKKPVKNEHAHISVILDRTG